MMKMKSELQLKQLVAFSSAIHLDFGIRILELEVSKKLELMLAVETISFEDCIQEII